MPGGKDLSALKPNFNPGGGQKARSRVEVAAELARVDAAIEAIAGGGSPDRFLYGTDWCRLGHVSVPIAFRSLRHYRQRLVRAGR